MDKNIESIADLKKLILSAMINSGMRFDKSWRHAETGPKAAFYELIGSTFLLNIEAEKNAGDIEIVMSAVQIARAAIELYLEYMRHCSGYQELAIEKAVQEITEANVRVRK